MYAHCDGRIFSNHTSFLSDMVWMCDLTLLMCPCLSHTLEIYFVSTPESHQYYSSLPISDPSWMPRELYFINICTSSWD